MLEKVVFLLLQKLTYILKDTKTIPEASKQLLEEFREIEKLQEEIHKITARRDELLKEQVERLENIKARLELSEVKPAQNKVQEAFHEAWRVLKDAGIDTQGRKSSVGPSRSDSNISRPSPYKRPEKDKEQNRPEGTNPKSPDRISSKPVGDDQTIMENDP